MHKKLHAKYRDYPAKRLKTSSRFLTAALRANFAWPLCGLAKFGIMRRYLILILTFVLFLGMPAVVWAGKRTISSGIYRQTLLNNITDSIATLGKSDHDKSAIEHQRHMARARERQKRIYQENHKNIIRR